MKAWRFHGFNDMRLDDVPEPTCRPGQVLVEPLCVQPSVTEAQLAQGIPDPGVRPRQAALETEAPVQLFGHEFCARIRRVGRRREPVPSRRSRGGAGQAAVRQLPSMPRRSGADACRKGPVIGFDLPGCFAERALLPEIALVKVDDRISDSEAACLQSLSDSVAAVETAGIRVGDSVAIFGQGSMGLECMQIARISGAGLIITVDVATRRAGCLRELGADHALNAGTAIVVAAIQRSDRRQSAPTWSSSAPAAAPSKAWPAPATLLQAIDAVRSGGKIIGVSWFGGPPCNSTSTCCASAACAIVFPDISTQAHLEHTVRLVASGRVRLKPTITHVLNGIESVPEAFEITANKGEIPGDQPGAGAL